jgi:hypothetical protein
MMVRLGALSYKGTQNFEWDRACRLQPWQYIWTRLEVTDCGKHSSLLRFGRNYDRKSILVQAPETVITRLQFLLGPISWSVTLH